MNKQPIQPGRQGTRGRWHMLAWGMAAVLLLFSSGCQHTSPSGNQVTASQVIEGSTIAQILSTTSTVFKEHGFEVKPAPGYRMIFEREGTSWNRVVYGSFMSPKVWLRARVSVSTLQPGRYVIDCDVKYVRNRGEIGVEDEQGGVRSGEYQEILKQIKTRLQAKPPEAGSKP